MRKAVRVLAERKADGVPLRARRVREPCGEVERELLLVEELVEGAEEMEEAPDWAEKVEGSTWVLSFVLLLVEEWERDGAFDMELAREGEADDGDIGLVVES